LDKKKQLKSDLEILDLEYNKASFVKNVKEVSKKFFIRYNKTKFN